MKNLLVDPRVIRLKEAHHYLGMSRSVFNQTVRPYITQIPIGRRGVGFDRLDLDHWLEDHKTSNGIPATKINCRRNLLWQKKERQASTKGKGSGTSISNSSENDFAKALEQILYQKRK